MSLYPRREGRPGVGLEGPVQECRPGVKGWRSVLECRLGVGTRGASAIEAYRESNWESMAGGVSAGVQTGSRTWKLAQEAERVYSVYPKWPVYQNYSVFQKGSDFQSVGKPMREVSTMG